MTPVPNDSETKDPQISRLSKPELMILKKPSQLPDVAEERALGPVRVGIGAVSRHQPSFVQLYYAIEARRTSNASLVVQFISPTPGAGASTVASGYARVAADDCANPVLFVDCTDSAPRRKAENADTPTLFDALRRGLPLSDATAPVQDAPNLHWARLAPGPR